MLGIVAVNVAAANEGFKQKSVVKRYIFIKAISVSDDS